jgi:hypothetical protein
MDKDTDLHIEIVNNEARALTLGLYETYYREFYYTLLKKNMKRLTSSLLFVNSYYLQNYYLNKGLGF